ncbi:MAG: WecB/TagA/CpsF family glycosyltransferase [Terriglobia bacterium]|jgi:N-acetylglucosaminyldiphosphoundecaprenol N-acetyl-beta-D-mannosaminyltransferase
MKSMTAENHLASDANVPCVRVLGVPVHVLDVGQVLQAMEQWLCQRDRTHWIAVTSSHGLVEAQKNPAFRTILESADLSVPDGKWTARVAAKKAACAPRQVRGADLLRAFCRLSNEKGYTNFFYGDTEEVLALCATRLSEQFPRLRIVGTYSPPFRELTPQEDAQVVKMINQTRPDVLWVGLGLPKQEEWIFSHREKLNVPVTIAVGAAFKFVSGKVKSAPAWIRESGFEWLWRFFHEPGRTWRRAFVYGPQFAARSILELSGRSFPSRHGGRNPLDPSRRPGRG